MNLPQLKIVSFNIWDLPLWFVKDRSERITGIADYLISLGADIVCLQESFDIRHRQLLMNLLRQAGYFATSGAKARLIPITRLDTTGGLVIFSKFPLVSERFTLFPRLNYSAIEYFARKGILESVVSTPLGLLRVLNTHLYMERRWIGKKMRLRQLATLLKQLEQNPSLPTVLAGDFNEHDLMRQPEYQSLLSARNFVHPVPEHSAMLPSYRTTNRFVDNWINRVGSSRRLDYILVDFLERLNLRVAEYAPVYLNPELSDHDPVVLSLSSYNR